jgi:hypothetical protein
MTNKKLEGLTSQVATEEEAKKDITAGEGVAMCARCKKAPPTADGLCIYCLDEITEPPADGQEEEDAAEFPSVEQCAAQMARHPSDRYSEIIDLMTAIINLKGVGSTPSVAEILAQREAEEVGPVYHGFMDLVERVENVRQAVQLVAKALDTMANHPSVCFSLAGLQEALGLLDKAKPGEVPPEDVVEIPDDGEGAKA